MNRVRLFKHASLIALVAASAVPVVVACGGSSKPADTGGNSLPPCPPNGGATPPGYPGAGGNCTPVAYGSNTGYPYGSATASASQGPMGPVTADSGGLQQILAGVAAAASAMMANTGATPTDAAESGLRTQAAQYAPGLAPDGQMMKQSMTQGQHVAMSVPMDSAHCYVIVGYSPPGGVSDLDLNLLMPPLYLTLAGQDASHHNHPYIAGTAGGSPPPPMCPMFNLGPYKLDILANAGSGQVAVQVYSKPK